MEQQPPSPSPDPEVIQRIVQQTEAEAASESGEVRIVAGPGGKVKEIDLRFNAFQLSGVELGELIVETMHAAHANVERELAEELGRATGLGLTQEDLGTGLPTFERPQEER